MSADRCVDERINALTLVRAGVIIDFASGIRVGTLADMNLDKAAVMTTLDFIIPT